MPKVRYNVAISLDGFIAPPDGSTDWIVHDPTIDFVSLFAEFDKFVMGRKTYEYMFSQDPRDNPLHGRGREDVIVASRAMDGREYPGVTVVGEDVVGYVAGLKGGSEHEDEKEKKKDKDIWLFGGGELARSMLEAGMVDVVEAAVMPVLLGDGVKMVGGGLDVNGERGVEGQNWKLELDGMKRLDSGILMCRYNVLHAVK